MKKLMQYLPFILWSISTIILTFLAFIILPILLVWEKFYSYIRKDAATSFQMAQEYKNTYAIYFCQRLIYQKKQLISCPWKSSQGAFSLQMAALHALPKVSLRLVAYCLFVLAVIFLGQDRSDEKARDDQAPRGDAILG